MNTRVITEQSKLGSVETDKWFIATPDLKWYLVYDFRDAVNVLLANGLHWRLEDDRPRYPALESATLFDVIDDVKDFRAGLHNNLVTQQILRNYEDNGYPMGLAIFKTTAIISLGAEIYEE